MTELEIVLAGPANPAPHADVLDNALKRAPAADG